MADSDKEPNKEIDAEHASPDAAGEKDVSTEMAASASESTAAEFFGTQFNNEESSAAQPNSEGSSAEESSAAQSSPPESPAESTASEPLSAESQSAESKPADNAEDAGTVIHDPATPPHQHHVSNILDEVLEEPSETEIPRRFKHPMWLDLVLAVGLLVAMGGFAIGLFKIYLTHTAEQCITQGNYKVAIALLRGAPFPGLFVFPGSDADELLNQAMYQDAMDRIDSDNDVDNALKELQQIRAGSRYFSLAQEFIKDNFEPSPRTLQGGVQTQGKAVPDKKPLLPPAPQDASP